MGSGQYERFWRKEAQAKNEGPRTRTAVLCEKTEADDTRTSGIVSKI